MCAYLIIIFQVRQQHMSEVPPSEHNNVVKAFPSCPDRRQTDIAGEARILGCQVVDRLGYLLRMNRCPATCRTSKLIEAFARFAIVFVCPVEMTTVSVLLEAWQECVDGRAYVTNHGEIDRRAAPDGLRPHIGLGRPDPRTPAIELSIGEASP